MNKVSGWLKQKRAGETFVWLTLLALFFTSLVSLAHKERELKISSVQLVMKTEKAHSFLDSVEIFKILNAPDSFTGIQVKMLNTALMETRLEKNPYVQNADVVIDVAGKLTVSVVQRIPVMRVFNRYGESYYVSNNGYKMPVNSNYTARVQVANGEINERLADSSGITGKELSDLWQICTHLSKDAFWYAQIEQIYVDKINGIVLIPKVGNHTIVLGTAIDIEKKLNRLKEFYSKGLNSLGWNKYKCIRLNFNHQVVAEKRE